ncbi:MAG: phosphoribosylformylglycinamidine synthase subunit PurL [Chloroflexi bacterium]|nr:phosphoribosylformylglycinamidine synthase subunit PurL [Chloroflexota bacterium]MCL5273840.1 phosphoribosylformylglycinamidine synthase subunit PurL [Chloroflexota bacterium]
MTEQTSVAQSSVISGTIYRIDVIRRRTDTTLSPDRIVTAAHQMGINGLRGCEESHLYFLHGTLDECLVKRLCSELLADPVTDLYAISIDGHAVLDPALQSPQSHSIEVTLHPGVTDPAAEDLIRAAQLLGIAGLDRAATAQRYVLTGELSASDLEQLATGVLSNPVVQRYAIDRTIEPPFFPYQKADSTVERIPLRDAGDTELLRISSVRRLALDLNEMRAIRNYYALEKREPTDVELEMLAQTWSEHCVHKTFKAIIDTDTGHNGKDGPTAAQDTVTSPAQIDGLLRTYIRAATERINKSWVRSAFVDNAGIVAFDDDWDLAFKVETHNHPSALEPFGGANTGVGGVIRDILGVSARPIANTDVLCFGPQDMPADALPAGVLHPRRIQDGVVRGVEDYGNKMGIPTVNGAILYHPGYTANPLVFCGCLGILPHNSHPSEPHADDLVIVIGGRTGRDGLRGATFSSMEMDQQTGGIAGSAVQIGHPIHEKQAMEAVLRARDEKLYSALTDCGAGGLSSAVGELGRNLGVSVRLDRVPLKYPGLRPWEIWLSEAQERMVLAVPPDKWPRLQEICAGQSIEAICIGTFEASGRLLLTYETHRVADIAMDFLHDGIPRRHLQASVTTGQISDTHDQASKASVDVSCPATDEIKTTLLALLAHPNIRSKEAVVRVYDHEVQGGTAIKPLTGVNNHGPSDAAVLVPQNYLAAQRNGYLHNPRDSHVAPVRAVTLSAGIRPEYTELDPYAMAWAAVDEAIRNAVCVGADPDRIALLDNFCWGNPNLPDRLGSLVRCAQGCYDAAIAYNAPFVSGKDSLNNEYTAADGRKHAIPGTLLISALGIVPDVERAVSMDLKGAGNLLYIVGDTRPELGGSHYSQIRHDAQSTTLAPQPVPGALVRMQAVHRAIMAGLVQACHDCSEGGIGVALGEMCLAGQLGAEVQIEKAPVAEPTLADHVILFSESLSRFIVEVRPADQTAFEAILGALPFGLVGHVSEEPHLRITGRTETSLSIDDMDAAWSGNELQNVKTTVIDQPLAKQPIGRSKTQWADGMHTPRQAQRPRILIMHASGTNRDHDAALACEMAGGEPDIVHVNQLVAGERRLLDYAMLVVPGGFSYGDDLGAGTLWALDMRHQLGESVARFIADGRPVLGICNGFQALVKAGLLPGSMNSTGGSARASERMVTLAPNTSAQFECRWVYLKPDEHSKCIFTAGLDDLIYCPVAHGEGRVVIAEPAAIEALKAQGLVALTYVDSCGRPASYPGNPNGSMRNIAGLTNQAGNVLGLMPHPENHIFPWQHPRYTRGANGMRGLGLFAKGIQYARSE